MGIQFAVTTVLPFLLILIMFGLGLTLVPSDFYRIARSPRPVFIGIFCQAIVLPAVALGLCFAFQFPHLMKVGLMVLAASPGGYTSNFYSKLSQGDVPLNLTLTAVNSAIVPVTLPLWTHLAILFFSQEQREISFQFSKMFEIFLLVFVPVILGMVLYHKNKNLALKLDRPVQIASGLSLFLIVTATVFKERAVLAEHFFQVGWAILTFNLLSLGLGYFIPIGLKLSHKQSIAIAFEIGIHNAALALYVAIVVLDSVPIAIPATIYGVLMYFTAAAMAALLNFQTRSKI